MDMKSFTKGVWLTCESEKQKQEAEQQESLHGLLERISTKEEAKDNPLPTSNSSNSVNKLLDNWRSQFYHS